MITIRTDLSCEDQVISALLRGYLRGCLDDNHGGLHKFGAASSGMIKPVNSLLFEL